MNFGINSTRCSDDGKIAFSCASCNFIAVLATTPEIYPKFHSFPCYYIILISVLKQLLSYLENKSLFVTCFVKINEEIIEIMQKTSDIFIEAYVGHIY